MSDKEIAFWLLGMVALFGIGLGIGDQYGRERMERRAVRAGAGRYVVDDSLKARFEWVQEGAK